MNPLTNVKNINKLNDIEAELGIAGSKTSWHQQYKDSAYIFIGGLPFDLTEGDIICVFSQYGEIVNINLVRDKKSGKSRGYCFLAYEDQRSTILAVDNLNSIKLLGRVLRVDHVSGYRKPKEDDNDDDITQKLRQEGCAPRTPSLSPSSSDEEEDLIPKKKAKKERKSKSKSKDRKRKKKKRKKDSKVSSKFHNDTSDSESSHSEKQQSLPRSDHDDHELPQRDENRHCKDDGRTERRGDGVTGREGESHSGRDRDRFGDPSRYWQGNNREENRQGDAVAETKHYRGFQEYNREDRHLDRTGDRREERHLDRTGDRREDRHLDITGDRREERHLDRTGDRREERHRDRAEERRGDGGREKRQDTGRNQELARDRDWEVHTYRQRGVDRESRGEVDTMKNWRGKSLKDWDRSNEKSGRDSHREREANRNERKKEGTTSYERDYYDKRNR